MNLYKFFSPAWMKTCPHCGETISTGKLKKVKRNKKPNWYKFVTASHMACPNCGGFVIDTASNSPRIALFVAISLAIQLVDILPYEFLYPLKKLTFLIMLILFLLLLLALKHEYLIPEEDES